MLCSVLPFRPPTLPDPLTPPTPPRRLAQFFPREGETWLTGPSMFPLKLLSFWVIQAAWAFTVLLPVFTAQAITPAQPMGAWGIIGGLLFVACWAFETTADFQKNAFKNSAAGKGEFMRTGLFALCQFPNYAGEIGCWLAMFFWAGFPRTFIAHPWIILSPVFTSVLLLYVSGARLPGLACCQRCSAAQCVAGGSGRQVLHGARCRRGLWHARPLTAGTRAL